MEINGKTENRRVALVAIMDFAKANKDAFAFHVNVIEVPTEQGKATSKLRQLTEGLLGSGIDSKRLQWEIEKGRI